MAISKDYTYKNIDRPYDNQLEREGYVKNPYDANRNVPVANNSIPISTSTPTSGVASSENGSVERVAVKNGKNLDDIWIKHFIRSENWKPKKQGFYLDGRTGKAQFMGIYINGEIEATSGFIGGCLITKSSVGTSSYVSGPLGYGWQVEKDGKAEFQNVSVRGIIKTSVFEKDTISAVNGMVLVSKADVLGSDMSALDLASLTIKGETTFVANEVVRLKDGINDEWLLITDASNAPTYVVTRDLAASYAANNNPVWKTGTAVVSMGVGAGTKTGFISLDSSSGYSPFIDIYGRNSTTFSDYTLHARIGWLKGVTDSGVGLNATDAWGIYTDNAYIKGVIVANTGKIGGDSGWNIGSGLISSVNGSNTTKISSGGTYAIEAGPTGSPTFTVSHAGELVATSGTFGGSLDAASGTFAGTLDAGSITSGSIPVARTDAKCTNADADQTSANPQPSTWLSSNVEKAKLGISVLTGGYLKTDLLDTTVAYISKSAMISNAIIKDAHISGTISVGKTDAKCTNADADQTSANPQPSTWLSSNVEKAKLGTSVLTGGYLRTDLLKTSDAYITNTAMISNLVVTSAKIADATITAAKIHDLNADKITAGTLTGIVIQTQTSGNRIIMTSDRLNFYSGNDKRGFLTPDSTKNIMLGTAGSFYFTSLSGGTNIEFTAGGSIHIAGSQQNIRFSNSGNQLTDVNSSDGVSLNTAFSASGDIHSDHAINCGGDITNSGDIQCGGKFKSSDGSGGINQTGHGRLTSIKADGGHLYAKYRELTIKDGLITVEGSETDWIDQGAY